MHGLRRHNHRFAPCQNCRRFGVLRISCSEIARFEHKLAGKKILGVFRRQPAAVLRDPDWYDLVLLFIDCIQNRCGRKQRYLVLSAAAAKKYTHPYLVHDFPVWTRGQLCVNHRYGSVGTMPVMSRLKLVVFDIAGTIIEDHGEVVHAFAKALSENGIPFVESELLRWKGASKREVIRHFAEKLDLKGDLDEKVESSYRTFRSELERCYSENLTPIAGADDTFRWCKDRGILIATTTGFYREISELILKQTGWRNFFVANISSSDVRQGRPAPYMIFHAMEAAGISNVAEVMNVGDTPLDLRSGSNARVAGVVGVLTGAHVHQSLEREPHTHIINSVAELPDLIEKSF